ncbi:MAG: DMT family transporter [Pseudomonadota bacterium]
MSSNAQVSAPGPKATLYASALVFVSASVWGLFWLPLREIDKHGLTGPWVILAINLAPLVVFIPITWWRWPIVRRHLKEAAIIGSLCAAGLVFYTLGLIYTSIMRATLLFYLTPVWSTLFGMMILSEHVSWRRWAAIALGFAGLILILAAKGSVAGSLNMGDVMGLLSGIFWGAGMAYTRLYGSLEPADTAASIYLFSCLLGLALLWPLLGSAAAIPPLSAWIAAAPITLAFSLLIFMPTLFAVMWCAQRLSPGRVGILMMSEVLVAGISAPLLAGEVLTLQEFAGAVLIVGAGVLEVLSPVEQPQQAT